MEVEASRLLREARVAYRVGFAVGVWLELESGFDEREVRILAGISGKRRDAEFGRWSTRVYLAVGATDLRKGFDGLYGLVRSRLEADPRAGNFSCSATRGAGG